MTNYRVVSASPNVAGYAHTTSNVDTFENMQIILTEQLKLGYAAWIEFRVGDNWYETVEMEG